MVSIGLYTYPHLTYGNYSKLHILMIYVQDCNDQFFLQVSGCRLCIAEFPYRAVSRRAHNCPLSRSRTRCTPLRRCHRCQINHPRQTAFPALAKTRPCQRHRLQHLLISPRHATEVEVKAPSGQLQTHKPTTTQAHPTSLSPIDPSLPRSDSILA